MNTNPVMHLDFETRSATPLPDVGAPKYAAHASTDLMCAAVKFNEEKTLVRGFCHQSTTFPHLCDDRTWKRVLDHVSNGHLVVAHNSPFEIAIWNTVGTRRYGFPRLNPDRTVCTMARAYAMSLPGSLDGARAAVGITVEKDQAGNRLMLKLSQPRTREKCPSCWDPMCSSLTGSPSCDWCHGTGELYTWWDDPSDVDKLFAYCHTDVEVEHALDKRLAPLSEAESRVWSYDHRINARGVYVDLPLINKAVEMVACEELRLNNAIQKATNGQIGTCKATISLTKWLGQQGVNTPGVAKELVSDLLETDLPAHVRPVLQIRQEAAKSSTAKLKKMQLWAGDDSRVRGLHQYHGANTGRWAGRGPQTQNYPRQTLDKGEIAAIFTILEKYPIGQGLQHIETFHGPPMSMLSEVLRGMLRAAPGRVLTAVDWNAIEARITAWFAGEETVLENFRQGIDPYIAAAAATYRVLLREVTKAQRGLGKMQILAFGFGGGVGALQKMARGYRMKFAAAFLSLWEIATPEMREKAMSRFESEYKRAETIATKKNEPFVFLEQKEWLASELLKLAWRKNNPRIVAYWKQVENAAVNAVLEPGVKHTPSQDGPRVVYQTSGSFLLCTLPSGRRLTYPYPDISDRETPWGTRMPTLTYKYEDSETHKWLRGPTWGGSLVENLVQATARDLLAYAIPRVEERGYPIVMHLHDEIVTETEEDFGSVEELEEIVTEVPAWASGLPVKAEGWRDYRFRK